MITEDYVSFEVAKLLKEKRFDEECRTVYKSNGCIHDNVRYEGKWLINSLLFPSEYSAPTHQMAMKWLRGKSIFIQIGIVEYSTITVPEKYYFFKVYIDRRFISHDKVDTYYTYEEAVEAALKYSLENLI